MQRIVFISLGIVIFLIAGFALFNTSQTPKALVPTPSPSPQNETVNIQASFSIVTDTITRSFKAEKYHNQSSDVYVESRDPTIVHVKKTGITWDDFFKTLPMKLTKECLVTGDGEALCNGKDGTLKFYLNDIEIPNLLDQEVKDGDKALVKFSALI